MDSITSEDVIDALMESECDPSKVRLDLLEILGKQIGFGALDQARCAAIAFIGRKEYTDSLELRTKKSPESMARSGARSASAD